MNYRRLVQRILGGGLALLLLVGCSVPTAPTSIPPTSIPSTPTATPQPRPPVALAKVQQSAAEFGTLANALVASWNSRDNQAVRAIFTDDAVAQDMTFFGHETGSEAIAGFVAGMTLYGPDWQARVTDQYIGVGDGLVLDEYWNIKLHGHQFTQADPVVEVDRLQIREDRIATWDLFYTLDSMEKTGGVPQSRFNEARALLSAYQTAWSSRDPQAVAALYVGNAVRKDTIFGESQAGRADIAAFAKTFFGWYPGVQWTLNLAFGDGHGGNPVTGGTYAIRVSDLSGQPCDVQVAVLLWTSENLISQEITYYEPESLVKCGWAR